MALVTRNTLRKGRRAAFLTTLGIVSGLPVHAFLSAVGLSVILSQSAVAFEVVKYLGACYLFYLGLRTILTAGKEGSHSTPTSGGAGIEQPFAPRREGRPALSYVEGLFTNLLNPKVALFYLTFLPQFISPGDPVIARSLLLAGIHGGLGVIWLTIYAYFVSKLSELLNRPRVKRNIERVTGALLLGFGLRLVWEQR